MRVLRWGLGLLIIFWGMINLVPLVTTYGYKAGWVRLPPDLAGLAPLAQVLNWWQALVWLAVVGLYVFAGWRLFRDRPAFGVLAAALIVELVRWLPMQNLALYRRAFTSAELHERYEAFALLVLALGWVRWIDRQRSKSHGA
jgi:hypothetical protein